MITNDMKGNKNVYFKKERIKTVILSS